MGERLSVIAGSGALVPEVLEAAQRQGFEIQLLTLGRRRDLQGLTAIPFSLADPGGAIDAIRTFGATRFVMAGGVSISDLARERLRSFFSGKASTIGDTGLSRLTDDLAALTGARPLGVHQIAPELLAGAGHIAGPEPTAAQRDAAAYGLDLARRAGALDLGQAVVVAGRRAIAAEDIGGTDALLARVRRLRTRGHTADGGSPLVLAKAAKPDQPLYIDLPAIGPVTIARARRAGVGAIVLQAGAALLIGRRELTAAAARARISVFGMVPSDA
ncbi:MAG TPA: UDP-2,3-diacylglucosamine diphosphatase LpxI [Devosiaceae bacterium]|jgi:hypothetical protein|nr:UDP-2,3-diacylglucosamine diphosphatase LpxI [Devosiaceae bacterium]